MTDPNLSFRWGMQNGGNTLTVTAQTVPTLGTSINFFPTVGSGMLPFGQFVCVETRIKNNTVGQADGLIQAGKDGMQFMNYTGLVFCNAGQYSEFVHFNKNRMYRQDGDGNINYDRLVFGDTRIGCIGSKLPPPTDTIAPAPSPALP